MSGINFINKTNDGYFIPDPLDDDITNMVLKFDRVSHTLQQ